MLSTLAVGVNGVPGEGFHSLGQGTRATDRRFQRGPGSVLGERKAGGVSSLGPDLQSVTPGMGQPLAGG